MNEKTTLKVKSILGPNTVIAGFENYEYDKIYYILNSSLFKYILNGNVYIESDYLYEIKTIKQIWGFIMKRVDAILSELRGDFYIKSEPLYKDYIKIIEHSIITGLFLQKLENLIYMYEPIRDIILENEPLTYVALFIYLKRYTQSFIRIPLIENKKQKSEKIDIKTILRIYKVISKHNLDKLKDLRELFRDLIMAITNTNYIDIEPEYEKIKKYLINTKKIKLKKRINQLRKDLERKNKQIEYLKRVDPSNPKILELEKKKKPIEEQLERLTKGNKIIKENLQNTQEKAKTESKELENKNGQ